MREIQLTRGGVALVDDDDYDNLMQYKWRYVKQKTCHYASTNPKINGKFVTLIMHRLIMNAPPGVMVDHIDCNGLNNQKSNLRFANYKQNGMNRRPNKGHKYKGVRISGKKFNAAITYNKKIMYLGTFDNREDAAQAYNEAAIKYHGSFARLNVIEKLPMQYRIMMLSI